MRVISGYALAQTAWGGCSGASSMCVRRERRKVLGRRQLCQRALLLLGLGGLVGAKAVQRPCSRTRPEPAPEEFPGESRCASALHRGRGALQQHRHIRHRPNFDLGALGIHALIDIVEQTNCWQKAECKEWSFLFDT